MRAALGILTLLAAGAAGLAAQERAPANPLKSFRCRVAISRGLDYLAAAQKPDGSWPASRSHDPLYDTAICGLALRAEGSTPRDGRFREALARAGQYVTARIPASGPIHVERRSGADYEHFETWYAAFAALFLTALYPEERPDELAAVLEALVRRLVHLQRETGGWCHDLRSRMARSGGFEYAWYSEDLAVASAYAVAALGELERAGASVPAEVLDRARAYFRRIHNRDGDGGYQYGLLHSWPRAVESEPGRSAAVVFALTGLGDDFAADIESATAYLTKNFADIPVSAGHANNVFSLNYLSGALACRRLGPEMWRRYVDRFVPRLLETRGPGGVFRLGKSHHDKEPMNTALALIVLQLEQGHLAFARPRTAAEVPAAPPVPSVETVTARGVAYLLDHQQENGSWLADPSYLDPRGKVMIAPPLNIFTDDALAVTALAARALLRHPAIQAERSRPAIERAIGYLRETTTAHDKRFHTAECSPIWQAYTIDFLLERRGSMATEAADARRPVDALVRRVIEYLAAGESEGGGWTYTYYDSSRGTPRSFCTALVVRSLVAAKAAGFVLPEGLLERARARLDRAPLEGGGYRYLYYRPDWPARATPMGSVGRMALIEAARVRAGSGSVEAVERAVSLFFEHRALLDAAIEKQTRYGNEDCHHYFAYYHLAEALALLPEATALEPRRRVARHLQERARPDGSWWDSQRAGPSAATALALLALQAVEHPGR